MSEPEENFVEDQEEMEEAVTNALNEICTVKAYTLKPKELQHLKAAQYALRSLIPDEYDQYDARDAYDSYQYGREKK